MVVVWISWMGRLDGMSVSVISVVGTGIIQTWLDTGIGLSRMIVVVMVRRSGIAITSTLIMSVTGTIVVVSGRRAGSFSGRH